jgi:hypothetical protein
MLDAYIIERIRRERERARKEPFLPLHIEDTRRPRPSPEVTEEHEQKRGSVVIDFQL